MASPSTTLSAGLSRTAASDSAIRIMFTGREGLGREAKRPQRSASKVATCARARTPFPTSALEDPAARTRYPCRAGPRRNVERRCVTEHDTARPSDARQTAKASRRQLLAWPRQARRWKGRGDSLSAKQKRIEKDAPVAHTDPVLKSRTPYSFSGGMPRTGSSRLDVKETSRCYRRARVYSRTNRSTRRSRTQRRQPQHGAGCLRRTHRHSTNAPTTHTI